MRIKHPSRNLLIINLPVRNEIFKNLILTLNAEKKLNSYMRITLENGALHNYYRENRHDSP